ncbi:peroxiredoxin [Symbiobacterium terraclitae]|uniref:Peroxiredoxin n=1 Tax=Symbiobacterium terraclitae TaxID=557451 RepID=A0ABS4JMP9_9FIRM|nr:peroxiredoxin [Symbiobacterium terraclitae]
MVCPECGTRLEEGGRFCHGCGWDSQEAAAARRAAELARRPAWKRWVSGISLGVLAAVVLVMLLVPRTEAETVPQVGTPAPDFALETLDGDAVVRLSDLAGQPVVINFWATWCPPCRKEMPDFQQVYDKYKEMGLRFYAVNVGESRVAVRDFAERLGVDFPILIDADESAQRAYRILPIPATFFIDRDGIIRGVYQYQMSLPQIEAEVGRLLAR